MKKALLLGALWAFSTFAAMAGNLQMWQPIPVVQMPSDGILRETRFLNTSSTVRHIKQVHVLLYPGSYTQDGYLQGNLRRISDLCRVAYWAENIEAGQNANDPSMNFSPDSIDIAPGDGLKVDSRSMEFGGQGTYFVLDIWYTE